MAKRGSHVGISSGHYGKAFLAKAWNSRSDLSEYEQRGFAVFFYLTVCGHVEAVFAAVIRARLSSARFSVRWADLPELKFTREGISRSCSMEPVTNSILRLLEACESELESAPLTRLTELYGKVFGLSVQVVLGEELSQDLKALGGLRNQFAHGRDLFVSFQTAEAGDQFIGTLDGNPLRGPAERLKAVGVIQSLEVNGQNHGEFFGALLGERAMFHFYEAANAIESAIKSANVFEPEQSMVAFPPPLPTLEI